MFGGRVSMNRRLSLAAFLCVVILATGTGSVSAHGLAGKRFFPATLVIDDPFVAEELSLPSVFHIKMPPSGDKPATRETDISADFSKRITPNLGLSVGGTLIHLDPEGEPGHTGFGNLELGLKYQFFKNDPHEMILSAGFGWEVGGTGSKNVGAESFSILSPAVFFGKGFGDLPDALSLLKPLAVTGIVEAKIPTRSSTKKISVRDEEIEVETERNPDVLRWGFVIEYSLQYLQSFVKDVGLPAPFNRMIPLVELEFKTPLDRGGGKTTGTINPGVLWAGKFVEVGLEAVIPINDQTGKNVGVRGFLHFFLDDLFPKSLGRPLFGG